MIIMSKKAVYPGSFDPITNGHVDIIERAAKLFDHVYVVASVNIGKNPFFTIEERLYFLQESLKHIKNVTVDFNDKFVYEYALAHDAYIIIRGLRTLTDYQSENQLFNFNYELSNKKVDTIALFADIPHIFLASSVVKEIAAFKGDVEKYVPKVVADAIKKKNKTAQ